MCWASTTGSQCFIVWFSVLTCQCPYKSIMFCDVVVLQALGGFLQVCLINDRWPFRNCRLDTDMAIDKGVIVSDRHTQQGAVIV